MLRIFVPRVLAIFVARVASVIERCLISVLKIFIHHTMVAI